MNLILSLALFVAGLALVIYFAERLVKGVVGTSAGFGVSAFVISVLFIGFDPENLAVGAVASYEAVSGIALGSVIGAAMVAIGFAFGLTALIAPMTFEQVPRFILAIPLLALSLFTALAWDGSLSRLDGGILLGGFVVAVATLWWLSRQGLDIKPTGEVAETLEEAGRLSKWKSLGLLLLSLVAIVVGSEMLVAGSRTIIDRLGLSDTLFGMTILAFLVSVEELARELPAALRGRPEISYGNVVGSVLAFFGFNAGIIALVRPVAVEPQVLRFHLPLCAVTVLATTLVMLTRRVPRWAGAILVLLYFAFVSGGYLGWEDLLAP
ncbi:MAG TPA: sodium:calcium antiporter [Gemmataceae bacterium]|nr:sodium:calcium antiporter [Gemmataceae bacterium]